MILLNIITTRTNAHNTTTIITALATQTATGRDSIATVTSNTSQIAKFKSKAIHIYILNLCEGTL